MNTTVIVQQRMRMFADKDTWWGRNRMQLCDLEKIMDFPDYAYYEDKDGNADFRAMLLKRKWLNRLRQELLKVYRRKTSVYQLTREYWRRRDTHRLQQWIEWNKQRNQ